MSTTALPVVDTDDPHLVAPLTAVDYAWLRMDDPTNLMMISGVLTFGSGLDRGDLRALLEARLLPIPRFRQRVVLRGAGGKAYWQNDTAFELDRHLEEVTLEPDGEAHGGDVPERDDLQEMVCDLLSRPLDRTRPLWSFRLVHGYQGGSALICRLHHSIGDGMALMLVLLSLAEASQELSESLIEAHRGGSTQPPTEPPTGPEGGDEPVSVNPFLRLFTGSREIVHREIESIRRRAEALMPEGMRLLLMPADVFRRTNKFLAVGASLGALARTTFRFKDPDTLFKGPLGVAKRAAWSRPIPMSRVLALKASLGGTVNDLLLTAMTGSLRRYLVERGEEPAPGLSFRAAVPVNLRGLEEMADLGNQFGLVFLALPVGIEDPAERLAELQRRMNALKRSAEPLVVYRLLQAVGRVVQTAQRAVVTLFARKTTAVMTNVPGPRAPLFIAGRSLDSIFFWVPQAGRVGLGISILSYAGNVRLGVATDAGLVPDPERIIQGFYTELEAMAAGS